MESGQSFSVLVRKGNTISASEETYHVTVFKRIVAMDELLELPEISSLIKERVVRMEKVDNFRFKIFLNIGND